MTRTVRAAVGAVVAAEAARSIPLGSAALLAASVAAAVLAAAIAFAARGSDCADRGPWAAGARGGVFAARRRWTSGAFLVGAALVLARAAIGGPAAGTAAALPDRIDGAGRVISVSAPREGAQRFVLQLDDPPLLLYARGPRYPEVGAGTRVRVSGRSRAPGDDAYGSSLVARGIAGTLDARSLALAPAESGPGAFLATLRAEADRALRAAVPEPAGGLAAGVLLGLRERVPREVTADFVATGLSHVVAISGWNIAIVAAALAVALRRFGRRRRTAATLLAICAYVALVGASPPVVRAALMAATVMVARESGRAAAARTALAVAVVAMLLADPAAVDDQGFRLSSAATAGLIAWGTPMTDRLSALRDGRLPPWLAETLGVSLAAQAATLPLVLVGFGRVSLVSPAVNLVVAPVVAPAMAAGAVALVAGVTAVAGLPGAVAAVVGIPAWVTFGAIIAVASVGARVPYASVTVGAPWDAVLGAVAAVGLLVFGTARGRRVVARAWRTARGAGPRREARGAGTASGHVAPEGRGTAAGPGGPAGRWAKPVALALAVAIVGLAAGATRAADGRARVEVLDVGQGDAILLTGTRGGRALVDGGPDPDRLIAALDARVPPWDRRVDLVVVTHPHEDHAAGLAGLLGRYRIGRVAGSGLQGTGPGWAAWAAGLAERRVPASTLATGDALSVDEIRLRVLWPDRGTVRGRAGSDGREVNDTSVVLLGEADGVRFLLPGDAEDAVDPVLVARGLPRVALYKVAHHGSRTASSDALLAALSPRVAAISVGAGNTYGHPSPRTLARLSAHGATIFRTDLDGTIAARFDHGRMEVRGERRSDAAGLGYHRRDDRPRARRVGGAPPLPRSAAVVPATRVRRRRDRRLARGADVRGGPSRGRLARRGGRAPPRRGQAPPLRSAGRGPPARGRLGRLARARRAPRARAGGRRPRGDAARRAGRDRSAARGIRRGPDRGVRGQARRAAPGADGRALRVLGPPLPRGPRRRRRSGGTGQDAGGGHRARARGLRPGAGPAGGGPPPEMDGPRPRGRPGGHGRRPGTGRSPAVTGSGSAPVILVTGDDALGIERVARRFAAEVADPAAMRTVRVVGVSRPASLAEERSATVLESVATGSLFGDGAFVVVADAPALLGTEASGRALLGAIGLVADGNVLALLALADESGHPRAGVAALEKAVAAVGGVVRSARLPADLERWIADSAPEVGVRLGRGAAAELARRLGGQERSSDVDRRGQAAEAEAELAKLALYREGGEVTIDDVRAVVSERLPASVFELLDAIGARRTHHALGLLERAAATVPGPVLVVRIHRRLREIAIVEDLSRSGARPADIAKALDWRAKKGKESALEWRVRNHQRQAAAWSAAEIAEAIDGLLAVDAAMKGDAATSERAQRLALVLWIVERVAPR